MPTAVDLHTDFAVALLHAVPWSNGENVVLSPWSVSSALAVLAPGVDQPARHQIEHALGWRPDVDDLVTALASDAVKVTGTRGRDDESVLVVANSLWVDAASTPSPAFTSGLEQWPGAALRSVAMAHDPEAARAAINADVAATTRELIPEILPRGSISPDERAVIVNALYLLVGWVQAFAKSQTVPEPFHGPGGTRDVPTMRGSRELRYARSGWEYVAVPLWFGLHAEVLLPPLTAASELDAMTLGDLRTRAMTYRVDLHLPRFRVDRQTDLTGPLHALGVRRVFDHPALVDVVAEEPLEVSGAFHAAVLKVDEEGIEGAAATAILAGTVAFREIPEVEVRIDRPFVFLVTHRETGAVIFLAYVAKP